MSKAALACTLTRLPYATWVALALLIPGDPVSAQAIGPSTTVAPYLLPNPDLPPGSVSTISILTAGDSVGGYRLVGRPDGLGAYRESAGRFRLLVNHELAADQGAVHASGSTGAFVSAWSIERDSLAVAHGEDLVTTPENVHTWNPDLLQWQAGSAGFVRFCSADLARRGTFGSGPAGRSPRIHLCGEETHPPSTPDHGRALAQIVTGSHAGELWELPHLGRLSFENLVANPHARQHTLVIGLDDASKDTGPAASVPSELMVYEGRKGQGPTPLHAAGLADGHLNGVTVSLHGVPVEGESDQLGLGANEGQFVDSADFSLYEFGDVSGWTGIDLQDASKAHGVMRFRRLEDGVWDPRPRHGNDFYFTTTASFTTNSRLWRLRFADIEHPALGGRIEILLKGDEGHHSLDNLTMDRRGRLVLLEDLGSKLELGKVWMYLVDSDSLIEVASHDPQFFSLSGSSFLTVDEESSGVIAADVERILDPGWFLLDVQAHYDIGDPELVEGGQLLALFVDPELTAAPVAGPAAPADR